MRRAAALIFAMVLIAGCAAQKRGHVDARSARDVPATRPASKAELSLDEIEPRPVLAAATRPATTQATTQPTLNNLALFAEARDAMLQNKRFTAINLLEKAIRADPYSYELHFALGQANSGSGMSHDNAIGAFEAAAAIEPDHIAPYTELGRLYLVKGEVPRAIECLRLARQTTDYERDDTAAAVVDFYLGKALQQEGYDLAALESYGSLVHRLQTGGLTTRGVPELAYLAQQPEALFVQVAELYERRGLHAEAIDLFRVAAARKPEDFTIQARLVRSLASAGERREATELAAAVVRQFRASPESLTLLREIYRKAGGDEAVARELQRLRRERPDDQGVLFALAEVLNGLGRREQAKRLLIDAARESNYQTDLVRRLYGIYDDAGDVKLAAQLLIEATAARPDQTRELSVLWQDLRRPWRETRITIPLVQQIDVPPQAQASKMFWLSELARAWNRDALAERSLAEAVKQVPPFPAAFRSMLSVYWVRGEWGEQRKRDESEALISSVERHGAGPLAAELRGLMFLSMKDPAKAAAEFAKAQQLGGDSVDLRLAHAVALQNSGQDDRAEQALWKLVEDMPTCEDAYLQLFHRALKAGDPQQAVRVLQAWLTADPANVNAKVLQATVMLRADKADTAERIYLDLLQREPNNPEVLAGATTFYGDTGRMEEFITKLEAHRAAHPQDRTVIEQLVLLYATRKQTGDAIRVLDETRAGMVKEPDLLYYLSGLYQRVGEKETSETVLQQVISIDPEHAAACNDLGYTWAEQNKNLLRAESLVRTAVQKEPDNQSYLDSLGWVYYKRGRFEQARESLETAIGSSPLPDPIILDHLGDAMYRLDRRDEAAKLWRRSQERLGREPDEEREEFRQLRLQLQQKIKQSDAGEPVSVAPTAEEPAKQAKTQ